MLSLQKLFVLAAILGAVWAAFRFIGRMKQQRDAELRANQTAAKRGKAGPTRKAEPETSDTEDMVACPTCSTFVPVRHPTACGRPNCPY